MRALAVVAVMVYHANPSWLPGGFLGVEVFFVISGYLITLLLIGEHERTGRSACASSGTRRARRLLPALFTLLVGVTIYTALFRRDALGKLRGDVLAGVAYVSNWYQIWVGQGYTASGDFAPLRHLWCLAVEEQFYLVWPLVMVGLIRLGRRRLPEMSRLAVPRRRRSSPSPWRCCTTRGRSRRCEATPGRLLAGRRPLLVEDRHAVPVDVHRATGLLLGSAFAMVWRPVAVDARPDAPQGPAARPRRRASACVGARRAVPGTCTSSRPTAPTRGCSAAASSSPASPRCSSSPP